MKKIRNFVVILGLSLLIGAPVSLAQYEPWQIDSFTSDIIINNDTSLDVTESIAVNFDTEKHGIYRDIPVHYTDRFGQPYNLRLQVMSVRDGHNADYSYELLHEGDMLRIKIGDPDFTVTGQQTYVIHYTVTRAYTLQTVNGAQQVEFPWNITGTWPVSMTQAQAIFHLPKTSNIQDIPTICFTGPQGSTATDCTITRGKDTITVTAKTGVPYSTQLTASLQIPASVMRLPSNLELTMWFLADNYMLVVAAGFFMLITFLWIRYGKELPMDSIVPRWEIPEDIDPFSAEVLYHEGIQNKSMAAGIIYLATRGYCTIEARSPKYILHKKKESEGLSPSFKKLFNALFISGNNVSTDDLKNKFYVHIAGIKNATFEGIMAKKWFFSDPPTVKVLYILGGLVPLVISIIVSLGTDQDWGTLACFMVSIYWIILSLQMPKKTQEGRKRQAELLGLREYIGRAEKLRLEMKNPPGHTRNEFDRLLPYAMIFDIENTWANQFSDILKQPPDWLEGDTRSFYGNNFLPALYSFQSKSVSTLVSTPPSTSTSSSHSSSGFSSFSGGGFSGGGFGGGGGGSW